MTLPGWLLERLENHRRRYAPIWQGFLSDHLPMAAMALVYQSTPRKDIEQWMDKYQQQLEPAPEAPVVGDWHEGIGTPEAYGFLLTHFDAELSARGEEYVLHKYLPELISGWVRDAFHPLIRLGYARRFGCHTEISAGLAYLTIKGPDPRLEAMAQAAAPGQIAWPPAVRLRGENLRRAPARSYVDTESCGSRA